MSIEEIATLTRQGNILKDKVTNLEIGITALQRSLARIEQGLFGDSEIGHEGALKSLKELRSLYIDIAARVEDMRIKKANEDSLLKNNKGWLVFLSSTIGGVIVWFLNYLANYIK